ncbi:hypothetical protein L0B53_02255 [Vibrio sp. SS-MA-C1-2]|uniref:hypothetical protein n=1 Tax=Vibrio sp. SS-MA-C1-2 TaxID=2908646 RepID=UPI001F4337E4|nr:hypothetical protein [Vibrio sp. SS-MA-C1-2]UJF17613.1 hypothetical protein L0B53_02255 [Vibrio sp. SS-MA-C1-2]
MGKNAELTTLKNKALNEDTTQVPSVLDGAVNHSRSDTLNISIILLLHLIVETINKMVDT